MGHKASGGGCFHRNREIGGLAQVRKALPDDKDKNKREGIGEHHRIQVAVTTCISQDDHQKCDLKER